MTKNVVFLAPHLMPGTLVFLRATAQLPNIQLGIISHHPASAIPPDLKPNIEAHYQIQNALDPIQVAKAAQFIGSRLGGISCLLGYLEELQVTLGEVRDMLGIPGLGKQASLNFRDKSQMKTLLRQHGLPCAAHAVAHTAKEAIDFCQQTGFPVVVKPPAGLGTRNTYEIKSPSELKNYLAKHPPSNGSPVMLEEFVVGSEHSFESMCRNGQTLWHSLTRYYPTPLEVMQNPWIQWCVLLPRDIDGPEYADIRAVAARANQVLGMQTGLTHMEWFRRRDHSIAISEVGARPPGAQIMKIISYAHDVDFYQSWANLVVHGQFQPPERKYAVGAAYLRGQKSGRVKAIHGLDKAQSEIGGLVVDVQLPQKGQLKSSSYEGEGYVLLRHEDTETVKHALKRLITLVQVEME
ncbi:MAG: ATP-grasp domain-containing protein [Acidobacteria bacterium]|nr:ATP-grasp domain-containing protein [Acidobacteriota bacterium]